MTKSNYLSSAAKYFAIVSVLILLPNLFATAESVLDIEQLTSFTTKITNFSFYLIIALTYVALNGEGVAYRKNAMSGKLNSIVFLKRYLLFAVIMNFSKNFLEQKVLSFIGSDVVKIFLQFSSSFLFAISSFSFLVTVVLIWYLKRDKEISVLFFAEMIGIASGVVYNIFKVFSYTVTRYDLKIYGESLVSTFSNQIVSDILCFVCCSVFIVVFVLVSKNYSNEAIKEEEKRKSSLALRKKTKDIYKQEGFGIDTAEDDFILNVE